MVSDNTYFLLAKVKRYSSHAISLAFVGIGLKGIIDEIRHILIVYPRLSHHLAKVNVTTDVYDTFVRNSVYMVVAHLMLATLGIALLTGSHHQARKLKFILGTIIIITAYAATRDFAIPTEAKEYVKVLIEGFAYSRH